MADKKHIWVVDDMEIVRAAVRKALGKNNYEFTQFSSADDAINKLYEIKGEGEKLPDLIITDYHTKSDQNGLHVVKEATSAGVRSVMLSAEENLDQDALQDGALKFFAKNIPLENSGLKLFVENLFAQEMAQLPHVQTTVPVEKTDQKGITKS